MNGLFDISEACTGHAYHRAKHQQRVAFGVPTFQECSIVADVVHEPNRRVLFAGGEPHPLVYEASQVALVRLRRAVHRPCRMVEGFGVDREDDHHAAHVEQMPDPLQHADVGAPPSIAQLAPTSPNLEGRFHQAMVRVYERARDEANYNARYFIQMVSESGGLGAARRLLASPAPAQGFTSLWEAGRLDLSVEATVLEPEYSSLFSSQELRVARRRLREYGFEPD